MNPDLDLTLARIIRASRSVVWNAWTDPDRLARWWLPAPTRCRVERLDVAPGGGFVTSMSDDGVEFRPHLDACFLTVVDGEQIVFTNAVDSRWRPTTPDPVAMTAVITMLDHPDGTDDRVVVKHGDRAARDRHEALGFADGWEPSPHNWRPSRNGEETPDEVDIDPVRHPRRRLSGAGVTG